MDTLVKLEDQRNSFQEGFKTAEKDNVYTGYVTKLGKYIHIGNYVCFGCYQRGNYKLEGGKSIKYIFSKARLENRPEIKIHDEWFDFLVNRSPFKDIYLTKDVEDIKKRGWVFDTKYPQNVVGNAMIATRFTTESHNDRLVMRNATFKELKNLGVDEWESYFFSHLYQYEKNQGGFVYNLYDAGHSVFYPASLSIHGLKKALKGDISSDQPNFDINVGYTYDTLDNLWEENYKRVHGRDTSSWGNYLKSLNPRTLKEAINLNIFMKADSSKPKLILEKDMLDILQQAKEYINA